MDRRSFLKALAATAAAFPFAQSCVGQTGSQDELFKISLAQWSLHRMLRGGKLKNIDFPEFTKNTFGITGVEYVNQFFKDKAKDKNYLGQLKKRCDDNGIDSVLIMCDGEGNLGDPNNKKRQTAVENHYKWVEAAKFLDCHSIRVNAKSKGSYDDQKKLAADGLTSLSNFAKGHGINVIVENHGGLSSNGKWLKEVMETVNLPNCGTLPDFGNFKSYDRYQGVKDTIKFAKGVSAKSHDFNEKGEEIHTDFDKMLKIVFDAGYRGGYIGVEYEGKKTGEVEGIKLTRDLLIKLRDKYSKVY
ncbi:MAG: sugar phosphate isomerase/epimerase [Lentisphaeraceae bacterium]|nr:sugar phosphate isomerase/epimerase [Lentisphaeraceae bacterium]